MGQCVDPAARILVVDDSHDAAYSFTVLLQDLGHKVEYTTKPLEAMDIARKLRPQIAFLDIGMPVLNGWELGKALREEFGYEAIRIVAITAYGAQDYRERSRVAGFDAHVTKPVDMRLVEIILEQVGGKLVRPRA